MDQASREELITHIAAGDIRRAGRLLIPELIAADVRRHEAHRFGELIEGVWWSQLADAEKMDHTVAMVQRVMHQSRRHGLLPEVLGYIRIVCEEAWELSWDHRPITRVIDSTRPMWEAPQDCTPEERAALGALWLLHHELKTETANSVGSLAHLVSAAEAGRCHAARVKELSDDLDRLALRSWLVDLAEETGNRLGALATAAAAAAASLRPDSGSLPPSLGEAVGALEVAERDERIAPEAASELRSHRAALRRLQEAADQDWLRVDEGTITHVFPFGLRTDSHTELIEAVKSHGSRWSLAGRPLDNAPSSLLLIDDIWRGEDTLNRRYEGTQIDLPEVAVRVCGREYTLEPSIVLSQIGNHHLRFAISLGEEPADGGDTGLLPQEMAALRLLSTPEYGDLQELRQPLDFAPLPQPSAEPGSPGRPGAPADLTPPADPAGWPRLGAFVARCLQDLTENLAAVGIESTLSYRAGMFHVITQIRRASALPGGDPDRARPLTASSELPQLFGASAVCGPLASGVGSIADWALGSPRLGTVVPTAIATDTLLMVNINHTLIASFTAPSFMIASVLEVVDFSVSLEGMFAAWQDELTRLQEEIQAHREHYPNVASMEQAEHHEVDRVIGELEQSHVLLRRYVSGARTSLLFIDSPALVASPVIRQTLNDLLALNPLWSRRAEYTDGAGDALSERYEETIGAWVKRRQDRKEARNRVMVETLLAVVAGIGISGIASLMQEGFGMTGWWNTLWLVLAVVFLAALIGVLAYRWTHTPGRRLGSRAARREAERERR
ncbi:hypothetical protein [Microbacterium sp. A93]|uniref:hypothetical protein n=1 Tax=Microbacterium sp. A93 TaxID=3450716 RepID=UPI003F41C74D